MQMLVDLFNFVDFQLSVELQPEAAVKLEKKGKRGKPLKYKFPCGVNWRI